jgi:hypothetical protein
MKLRPAKWGQSFSLRCGNPESHLTGSGQSRRVRSRQHILPFPLCPETGRKCDTETAVCYLPRRKDIDRRLCAVTDPRHLRSGRAGPHLKQEPDALRRASCTAPPSLRFGGFTFFTFFALSGLLLVIGGNTCLLRPLGGGAFIAAPPPVAA